MSKTKLQLFDFDNSYYKNFNDNYYEEIKPAQVREPVLLKLNYSLLYRLASKELIEEYKNSDMESFKDFILENFSTSELADIFTGKTILKDSQPIALAYAGHQFGYLSPQLGDGRAILLGEVISHQGGARLDEEIELNRFDLQLKGSGVTRYSRSGDGKASLGPVIREYIVSEAMSALGIPTTKALAMTLTGEDVYRQTKLPGAILTRVAQSHIRIGTFEYFAIRQDFNALKALTDYCIDRHYPDLDTSYSENKYICFLKDFSIRYADLVIKWLNVGFIHGVMNTDNVLISGETIDYGPCAFLDEYHPHKVFSSIDQQGRYAYAMQGSIAKWNLACLAGTLVPVIALDKDSLNILIDKILEEFQIYLASNLKNTLLKKIGLIEADSSDIKVLNTLLDLMKETKTDFTLTFWALSQIIKDISEADNFTTDNLTLDNVTKFHNETLLQFTSLFNTDKQKHLETLNTWLVSWFECISKSESNLKTVYITMHTVNPTYIPRNHMIEEVIAEAVEQQNYKPIDDFLEILKDPFKEDKINKIYHRAPKHDEKVLATFCGT
jgi:uncharacterized protein YdiU (UPF0061 family)